MNESLTFFGSLRVKIAEDRVTLFAPTFGALVFAFLPLFYRKRQRVLLVAFPALELIVWHGSTSLKELCFTRFSEKETSSKSASQVAWELAPYADFQ